MSLTAGAYSSKVFDVTNLQQAKNIILTPEVGMSTDQRWETETGYFADLILEQVPLSQESVIMDFGCGVGRISKVLIERTGCRCVGLDISFSMLGIGMSYVSSERYVAMTPSMLEYLDLKFDLAISIWALQHVKHLQKDIARIYSHLWENGKLFVINEKRRVVPTQDGHWIDDGHNIRQMIRSRGFKQLKEGQLDQRYVAKDQPERTFWGLYQK